jgi:hypothetical protein
VAGEALRGWSPYWHFQEQLMKAEIEDRVINQLIAELCAALELDQAAAKEVHRLGTSMPPPYTVENMKALWAAGDKMHIAHHRKMAAWERVRNAVAPAEVVA